MSSEGLATRTQSQADSERQNKLEDMVKSGERGKGYVNQWFYAFAEVDWNEGTFLWQTYEPITQRCN